MDYNFIPTFESLNEICQIIQENCYESILIPSHIVEIGSYTFQWCKSLKHIFLAEGVKRIGDFAFFECINLRTVFLSSTVESIGKSAFLKCDRIKSISVHQNNPYFILKDNILFTKDMTKLVLFPRIVELKNYSIPSNVIAICESSFHSSSLLYLYISANVREIGESAFRNTSCQFEVDENNRNFTIKDGILFSKDMKTLISSHAIAPDDYYVPATVEKICDSAFYRSCYCNIILPKNLKHIGNYAFESIEKMELIRIPQTVTHIGYCAFKHIPYLKMIDVDTNNQLYTSIEGVLFSNDIKTLIAVPAAIDIAELLTMKLYIPSSVFHFCDFSFSNFNTPFGVEIPDGVESIGNNCFENSYILSISIPASVTVIGHLAFARCFYLGEIKVDKDNPHFVSEDGVYSVKI